MLADELEFHVKSLALPIGRKVGTYGHDIAKEYLITQMKSLGLIPYSNNSFELSYQGFQNTFSNLIGILPGKDSSKKPILIGAHYDSIISAPCADDNAAALSILLTSCKILREANLEKDIVIAFFDAEEPPYYLSSLMGSVYFYNYQRNKKEFNVAIIMDLVGHDVFLPILGLESIVADFKNLLFMTGIESNPMVANIVKKCQLNKKLPVIATRNELIGDLSDHHIFRVNNIPYIFLSCGRWIHYHSSTDTPEKLNYQKMVLIQEYLINLIKEFSKIDIIPSLEREDTTELEIKMIKEALGEALNFILKSFKLDKLESKEDINNLARAFLQFL